MAKCFIYEKLNDVSKSMQISEENGMMRLSGVFGVCGVVNNNKRVYSKENYKKMVESLQQRIVEEGCPGELEHPNSMNINLERISHKVDSIQIDENGVVSGTITLLDTPQGKIAQAIVKGGLPLFVSSRAMGDVDKQGNVTLEMLRTYDLVGTPGFSQARLKLNESQVSHSINESMFYIENVVDDEQNATEYDEQNVIENEEPVNVDNTIEESNMTKEQEQALLNQIEELKSCVESLQTQIDNNNKTLCEAVQSWVVEHFAPEVEKWIVEHYSPEVEKWIVEHFAPAVEKWIVEQYSPEVEKWIVEEYSEGVQKWLFEQYAQGLQDWIVNEYGKETKENFEKMFESKENRKSVLSEIDEALKLVAATGNQPQKKVFESAVQDSNEPLFIKNMPQDARIKWDMASDAMKASITRKARLTRMTNESEMNNFWANVDWTENAPAPIVNESKLTNSFEERMIRMFKRQ